MTIELGRPVPCTLKDKLIPANTLVTGQYFASLFGGHQINCAWLRDDSSNDWGYDDVRLHDGAIETFFNPRTTALVLPLSREEALHLTEQQRTKYRGF